MLTCCSKWLSSIVEVVLFSFWINFEFKHTCCFQPCYLERDSPIVSNQTWRRLKTEPYHPLQELSQNTGSYLNMLTPGSRSKQKKLEAFTTANNTANCVKFSSENVREDILALQEMKP